MTDGHLRSRAARDGGSPAYPAAPEPLAVPVYDNHTHLEVADGAMPITPAEHLDRAGAVGIAGVVQVGTDVATSEWSAALAARDARVLAAVAIHPNDAPELAAAGALDEALATIDALAGRPRVVAVGETGLDWYRTGDDGRDAQFHSFEAHIDIAKRHGLALQIHDRDAHDDVVATLLRVGAPERTVFHCFSGDAALAAVCAEHGWFMSFAGNVTFKNAENLREGLRAAPRELVMVETDAPYLTPAPNRGRPNAPYLVPHTVRFMAEVLGAPVDELSAEIAANTERAYGRWDAEPVSAPDGAPPASPSRNT
ncbi:AraC family transcriptional regulator [Agromyces rhizosphaerae]|uniref:AraC family transcriptional regulator n=1 Tax=Agromyces rhizosphaerae TaxID=88374 RepID=A0A9W6FPP8_9MICO|nr:TatD family hydrolase [Agromyces rhizosphaerae]GLI28259.1 AraC family transcriptional regulator [Agromyces rhizosphaerae]